MIDREVLISMGFTRNLPELENFREKFGESNVFYGNDHLLIEHLNGFLQVYKIVDGREEFFCSLNSSHRPEWRVVQIVKIIKDLGPGILDTTYLDLCKLLKPTE